MYTFWKTLTLIAKIIIIVITLAIITFIVILLVRSKNSSDKVKTDSENSVEISQVFEPSIGTPLPADTNNGTNTTITESEKIAQVENAGEVAGDTTTLSAPVAGINDDAPIKYWSDQLEFSTTVPARTEIVEQTNTVQFFSKNRSSDRNTLEVFVTAEKNSTETLATIKAQLQNSSSVSNISEVTFQGISALKFRSTEFGSGIVFLTKKKIYYIFGNSNFLENFNI